jgi:hypothetical protein
MDQLRRQAAYEAEPMWKITRSLVGDPDDVSEVADPFDPSPRAQTVAASAVAPGRVDWLWPGRIPLGMLTLFSGDPKMGKSLVALSVIAAVSRGGPLPGGDADGPATATRGSIILLSAEDDPARTIVPRLLAAGADLDRVHILSTMLEPKFRGFSGRLAAHVPAAERMPTASAEDLRAIERRAAALGDCRLIVFDPVSAYLVGREADVRRALCPLNDMAGRLGAAGLLITHHSKRGASGTNGKYRVRGSIDYVGVCRANFLFLADPDDPGRRRLMLDNGGNLAPRQPGLAFVVHDEGGAARVEWLPETIDLDADAALARAVKIGPSGTTGRVGRRHACEEWLRGFLAGGPRLARECEQAALVAGFNRRLLERARVALAIRSVRTGFGQGSCCHLSLPESDGELPEGPDDNGATSILPTS